jgi:hypothetical protein
MSDKILKHIVTNPGIFLDNSDKYLEHKDYKCGNPQAQDIVIKNVNDCVEKWFKEDVYSGITLKPEQTEPTEKEINSAFANLKGCTYIKNNMGLEYLGCNFSDPDAFFSCDCPKVGKKFPKLLKFATKNSTFWNTDLRTPLARNAFTKLLMAFKISITVNGNFRLFPGAIIEIIDTPLLGFQFDNPKIAGKWLVLSAKHNIGKDRQHETTYILSAIANENFYKTFTSSINEINIQR